MTIESGETLTYSVQFKDRIIIVPSRLGFEFKDEPPMAGGFEVLDDSSRAVREQ